MESGQKHPRALAGAPNPGPRRRRKRHWNQIGNHITRVWKCRENAVYF